MKDWVTAKLPDASHVLPLNDLKAHYDSERCWCKPRTERFNDGKLLITHNSADGREFYENDGTGH